MLNIKLKYKIRTCLQFRREEIFNYPAMDSLNFNFTTNDITVISILTAFIIIIIIIIGHWSVTANFIKEPLQKIIYKSLY